MPHAHRLPARLAAAALAVLAALAVAAPAGARRAPKWKSHAPMRHARTEAAYALDDGRIFVIGGLGPSLVTVPLVEIYDVKADAWTDAAPLPVAVNHAMAASYDGNVYVAGGYTAVVFGAVNTFFMYDGLAWVPLPPMPETRAAAGMVGVDGKLYVIGGFTQQGQLATTTLVYDMDAGTWSVEEGTPDPREHHMLVEHDGLVYVIGGRVGSPDTNVADVDRFDPGTGKWAELAPMHQTRSGHTCAATSNGLIACMGGEMTGAVFDTAEVYDVRADRWTGMPSLPSGRTGFGSAAVGTRLYSFSGATDAGYLASMESIDLRSYGR
ncbi:MAG TPA: kelch repeat-containing protein [Actinomycetota bacterium]|nr:kelch repeat-containing protein [Actinomycetota bacterium]